jgi:hypothetical protein
MTARQIKWTDSLWTVLDRGWVLDWFDAVRGADLFVLAGTPLFYFIGETSFLDTEGEHSCNWPRDVFARRLEPANAPPFIALGVGSIYEGSPESVLAAHPQAAEFLRRFLRRAGLVTTRDTSTHELLLAACPDRADVVLRSVCPSLWAQDLWDRLSSAHQPQRNSTRVALSYSTESAGWDLTKPHEEVLASRRRALGWVVDYFLGHRYEIVLLSHNRFDVEAQSEIAKEYGLVPPLLLTGRELITQVNQAAIAVTWRVHGALAALAAGCPALLFRTDSRWSMAADLGASILDDRDLTHAEMARALDELRALSAVAARERIKSINRLRAYEYQKLERRLCQNEQFRKSLP